MRSALMVASEKMTKVGQWLGRVLRWQTAKLVRVIHINKKVMSSLVFANMGP
jgi:hypothetical protein